MWKGLLQHFRTSKSKLFKYKGDAFKYRTFCDYYNKSLVKIKDAKHHLEVLFSLVEGEVGKVMNIFRCHGDPATGLGGALRALDM